MKQERVQFENNNSEVLQGMLRVPERGGSGVPAVILCHGFRANKDREIMFSLWDMISRQGFACLRFDFSCHGESQGDFRRFTITQAVKDLKAAFNLMDRREETDSKRIGIVGYAFGGLVSVLFSAEHNKVKSLVSINSKYSTEQLISSYFSDYQQKEWKEKGYIRFHDFRELGVEFLEDSRKHDVLGSVKNLGCPFMAVHGTHDSATPFESARELFNHAKEPKRLELVDNADHHFTDAEHRQQLIDAVSQQLQATMR